jgi:hypothetical protein
MNSLGPFLQFTVPAFLPREFLGARRIKEGSP